MLLIFNNCINNLLSCNAYNDTEYLNQIVIGMFFVTFAFVREK